MPGPETSQVHSDEQRQHQDVEPVLSQEVHIALKRPARRRSHREWQRFAAAGLAQSEERVAGAVVQSEERPVLPDGNRDLSVSSVNLLWIGTPLVEFRFDGQVYVVSCTILANR
jgi:hypothetical protein